MAPTEVLVYDPCPLSLADILTIKVIADLLLGLV